MMWVVFRNQVTADLWLSQWHCIAIFSVSLLFHSPRFVRFSNPSFHKRLLELFKIQLTFVKWVWSSPGIEQNLMQTSSYFEMQNVCT